MCLSGLRYTSIRGTCYHVGTSEHPRNNLHRGNNDSNEFKSRSRMEFKKKFGYEIILKTIDEKLKNLKQVCLVQVRHKGISGQ